MVPHYKEGEWVNQLTRGSTDPNLPYLVYYCVVNNKYKTSKALLQPYGIT